jgi:hypothetical protein
MTLIKKLILQNLFQEEFKKISREFSKKIKLLLRKNIKLIL